MGSGLWRYYLAKCLPVLTILVVVSTGLLAWFVVTKLTDGSGADSSARPSAPNSYETLTPTSQKRTGDEVAIGRQVRAFSRRYFSLSPEQTQEEAKQEVKPYVTDNFLETAQFGPGSSEADLAMIREGASLKVNVLTDLVGGFLDANTVAGAVRLRFTKLDKDGNVMFEPREDVQTLTLIKQGDTWLVDDAPLA